MDVTSIHQGFTRETFLANLVASKLLSEAELESLCNAHPEGDALTLAGVLVKSGQLTEFQLNAINDGRMAELRVGNYDILDKLGAGGMGTVFKARHRRMKRIVALKVLSANVCRDSAFVQRFQREVETVARLGHPNVVMAYDADEAEIGHFLVMEFVDGRDLVSYHEKHQPLPILDVIDCILQAARGLAYAHSQGIVHRDIKPGNLLRDHTGVVKVTDLGLARLNTSSAETENRSITQAGGILGTVDYMAPEQAVDSTTIDHRADIYSLGATLYYLLAGKPPFDGASIMAVLLKHRDAAIPPLRAIRTDVPPELEAIYTKMMAKNPDQRHASMKELAAELQELSDKLSGAIPVPTRRSPTDSSMASAAPNTQSLAGANSPRLGLSVVVVEPSRVQAGIFRKYLEAEGYSVPAIATSGAEAIAAVREHRPAGLVATLHMSDMTGVELAQQVRSDATLNPPPGFVLVSSEAEAENTGSISRLTQVVMLQKPFKAEQLAQAMRLVTTRSTSTKPKVERSTLRVLLVDDTGSARLHERLVLQKLGITQFVECMDGAQAIAAATREKFDLIVTDYNMPLMDGRALVSYLKQTPATANIPIVMVTTETSPEILDPVRQLGVLEVLEKAFPAEKVETLLCHLFG